MFKIKKYLMSLSNSRYFLLISFIICYYIYSVAVYTSFFKFFSPNDDTILDFQAIPKAFAEGLGAIVFVLGIPFVFLGLGYLIHKFQQGKGWGKRIKLGLSILIAFIFLFPINYATSFNIIEKKYEIQRLQHIEDLPKFNYSIAFSDALFWLIFCVGCMLFIIGYKFYRKQI